MVMRIRAEDKGQWVMKVNSVTEGTTRINLDCEHFYTSGPTSSPTSGPTSGPTSSPTSGTSYALTLTRSTGGGYLAFREVTFYSDAAGNDPMYSSHIEPLCFASDSRQRLVPSSIFGLFGCDLGSR
jgi:hypothetical protein